MKSIITRFGFILIEILVIFVWRCPFETLTGIPCPGCMMKSAAYYLIQFDFKAAFYFNPAIYWLLLMLIPLIMTYKKPEFNKVVYVTLFVWFGIYVYRMMTIFPHYPMSYVEENMISKMMQILK